MRQGHPPTISTEGLHRLLSGGAPLWLVFAADRAAFHDGHIPGSLSATDAQLLQALPAHSPVVVYGEDHAATRAKALAADLTAAGRDARWYAGGLRGWASAGLPLEGAS